jgi:chemotaxis response regulator CheB
MHNSATKSEKMIRVLIANRPRLMRDLILATISDHAEIEVVGEVEDERDIRQNVEQTRPDYLVIALDQPDQRPTLCDALLRDFPEMKILAVSSTHDSGALFWVSMEFCSRRVEVSEEGVLNALHEFGVIAH